MIQISKADHNIYETGNDVIYRSGPITSSPILTVTAAVKDKLSTNGKNTDLKGNHIPRIDTEGIVAY